MITISIITLFPRMIEGFINESILKRAQEKKLVQIKIINLRDFAIDSYGTVDNKPYGGGIGMVIRVDVLHAAISHAKAALPGTKTKVVLTSARGKTYTQSTAKELSRVDHVVIVAGHYEGVDERIMECIDEEISVGDYVLTGGELPSCIIADSIIRLIPGVLKHAQATEDESFSQSLLEYPQYTRPEEFQGKKVPEILLSGNHQRIQEWKKEQSILETKRKRPDLLP